MLLKRHFPRKYLFMIESSEIKLHIPSFFSLTSLFIISVVLLISFLGQFIILSMADPANVGYFTLYKKGECLDPSQSLVLSAKSHFACATFCSSTDGCYTYAYGKNVCHLTGVMVSAGEPHIQTINPTMSLYVGKYCTKVRHPTLWKKGIL